MQKVLSDLNRSPGILGSLIVTRDGMPVLSDLKAEIKEDVISAITSSLVLSVTRSLAELKGGDFHRLTIACSSGKLKDPIAIGALHLPGKTGVLNLLAKKGYRVSVVY